MKLLSLYIGLLFMGFVCRLPGTETFHRKGNTLIWTNTDSLLSQDVKNQLVETFFEVYPKLVRDFNPRATKTVRVTVDTSYPGVAYASGGKIVISSAWLHKKPNDTDVITHEVMHLVQSYPDGSGPGWLTEGIADYVRYKYGLHNEASGWSLPEFTTKSSYTDSYRTTARFLVWLTHHCDKDLVNRLDRHLRDKTYSPKLWNKLTGKSLDELWKSYSNNSQL